MLGCLLFRLWPCIQSSYRVCVLMDWVPVLKLYCEWWLAVYCVVYLLIYLFTYFEGVTVMISSQSRTHVERTTRMSAAPPIQYVSVFRLVKFKNPSSQQ